MKPKRNLDVEKNLKFFFKTLFNWNNKTLKKKKNLPKHFLLTFFLNHENALFSINHKKKNTKKTFW